MSDSSSASTEWHKPARIGYLVILLTFGVVGGWAAIAPLDRATVATGMVTNEGSRKTVQHLEGGIVQEVLVKEGQTVKEEEVLFRLSTTQARANADIFAAQLDALLAQRDRLIAEFERKSDVQFGPELMSRADQESVQRLMKDQLNQFVERRATIDGQITIYEAKISQLMIEQRGLTIELKSGEEQVGFINSELVGLRELRKKDLIPVSRVMGMERERARLEGIVGRAMADIAKAENGISESRLQISQLRQKVQEEVSAQLIEARQKVADLTERLAVAQDVLRRQVITAPRTGVIQGLKVFTVGQVIRPGEQLLEIVPEDDKLVIHAQFLTTEIEYLNIGMTAEIRFPAFHTRRLPVLLGTLDFISKDRLIDEASRQPYYLGIVSISKINLPEDYRARVRAGMPAEVVVATGERTALNYMISPLTDSLRKSLRE
ncbi:MAG: HlyD family type I secretion periplasmic adaptor subunit [Rhabdaerophilum sp.]